uniref:Cathepsin propeptide inhibitor domain-containing protein n=1 Tax=Oryza brachyantha TaxID=4533 RepID=J3LV83_ORYBR
MASLLMRASHAACSAARSCFARFCDRINLSLTPAVAAASHTDKLKEVRVKFVAEEKSIWDLYKRWCKAFSVERDHAEMLHRFPAFKASVLFVHHTNNRPNLSYKLEITKMADGKLREICITGKRPDYQLRRELDFKPALFIDCTLIYLRGFSFGTPDHDAIGSGGNKQIGESSAVFFKASSGKLLKRVYSVFEVVNGSLFVDLPDGIHQLGTPKDEYGL